MQYSMDTSAFLDGFNRYYPPDIFPKLWENVEKLVKNNALKSTEMVLHELKRRDDDVLKWAKSQSNLFVNVDEEIQEIVAQIMGKLPRIVAEGGQRNMADPFVVAFAKQNNLIVVTGEKGGSIKKPKIPFVCETFDVEYISFVDLVRKEKWTF